MIAFIKGTIRIIRFLLLLLIKEDFTNYVRKNGSNDMCISKKLVILANGPSLKSVIEQWNSIDIFKDADILSVNFFCCDKIFEIIKPKYYVLSDPQFFITGNLLREESQKVFDIFNKYVTWKMFLYIQYYAWKDIDWSCFITNKNITVIPFHSVVYTGYEFLRNWFLKQGICSENYGTVILNAEIIGINLEYKALYLYGVDHTFFDNLYVDKKNRLCSSKIHFYDGAITETLQPLVHYFIPGKVTQYTMSAYLYEMMRLFRGHEILKKYADYRSVKIYNCTSNSLIDAYERREYDT